MTASMAYTSTDPHPPPVPCLNPPIRPALPQQWRQGACQRLESTAGALQELHAGTAPQAQAAAAKAQIAAAYAGLPLTTVTDDAGTSASLHFGDEDRISGGRDGNAIAK